ncbi:MAG: ABC transporter permease, partial [Caldilineaceae bacterium]|nr:ABC transporter permease [Caldilineaceae bacterium]
QGTFFPPGIYVSTYDTVNAPTTYTLNLDKAESRRIANRLKPDDRVAMKEWLVAFGLPEEEIDTENTAQLLAQWEANYDPNLRLPGMTFARQRYFQRVNTSIQGLLSTEGAIIAVPNAETGALDQKGVVKQTDYANVNDVANVQLLVLGTDNFGRDILTELLAATAISLLIGLVAGIIATTIGLVLGLVAGYVG